MAGNDEVLAGASIKRIRFGREDEKLAAVELAHACFSRISRCQRRVERKIYICFASLPDKNRKFKRIIQIALVLPPQSMPLV